ncbi:hypothetical protein DOY81_002637 [Sarcophaga bullata]|nr:hypothetical protein DOY81_002637 [Sarcophaga bullata]
MDLFENINVKKIILKKKTTTTTTKFFYTTKINIKITNSTHSHKR